MKYAKLPELGTERLLLRGLNINDAEAIFRLRTDVRVNELVDRKGAVSVNDAREHIQQMLMLAEKKEVLMWAVTRIGEANLIGTITFWHIAWETGMAEIGYELLPDYHGQGIMAEALKKVIDLGIDRLKFKTIVARPKAINVPSVRLLEKIGFRKQEELGDGYVNYVMNS